MARYPAEVFGYPADVVSAQPQRDRQRYWCPFTDNRCDKKTRLAPYPMGVCSVQYDDQVIAICPHRFLQRHTVFRDIAQHYFGSQSDLLLFREISIPKAVGLGRFDFVLVQHKPLSSEILDFVTIEFQTGQTTNTGDLVQALGHFMANEPMIGRIYGFGINYADIWKRAFTQVLTKGIVMERWGHKVYWVVQESIYRDLLDRYQLYDLDYTSSDSTVFAVYDLERDRDEYSLRQTRYQSATIAGLFQAFRTNLEVPSKDAFIARLTERIEKGLDNRLRVGLKLDDV